MDARLESGKYIIAVSGGVDSVVLLDLLHRQSTLELVVAHFNHGIRPDAAEDVRFVAGLAAKCGLPFASETVALGPGASEDTARKHRYEFLHKVREQTRSAAVVTAHHQDDVIETALLNVMRGTKRRGFVSLQSTEFVKRPLLHITKQEIYNYALAQHLEWYEDSTNQEMNYARNRVRGQIHKTLTDNKRKSIVSLLGVIQKQNKAIDDLVHGILLKNKKSLEKEKITKSGSEVASEIIAGWLRQNNATFDKKTIERVRNAAQLLHTGAKIDIDKHHYCLLTKHEIVLTPR